MTETVYILEVRDGDQLVKNLAVYSEKDRVVQAVGEIRDRNLLSDLGHWVTYSGFDVNNAPPLDGFDPGQEGGSDE